MHFWYAANGTVIVVYYYYCKLHIPSPLLIKLPELLCFFFGFYAFCKRLPDFSCEKMMQKNN